MDATKSFFIWPLINIVSYLKFIAGGTIALVPAIIHLLSNGVHSLDSFVDLFNFLVKLPLGLSVFSGIVPLYAPYTGSIYGHVIKFTSNECQILMPDYPWLRNPFSCLHAVALTNLGEFTSGIIMYECLRRRKELKGIATSIQIEFYKKARGTIRGVSVISLDDVTKDCTKDVITDMYDHTNTLIAKCSVKWNISFKEKKK